MKRIHYVGIIVILIVILGLFLVSPFSPLNKSSINGHAIKLPKGYTVQNSSDNFLSISNGTTKIYIISDKSNNINETIKKYKNKYNKTYNITQTQIKLDNGKTITKTEADQINGTYVTDRYWFVKDKKVYNIKTSKANKETENNIKSIISSM